MWVVVDLPAGQAIDSHKELTEDQGTHQGHPKGTMKRKTKSGRPDPVLRPNLNLVRAKADSRKLQVMRLMHVSVHSEKCLSLNCPFPSPGSFPSCFHLLETPSRSFFSTWQISTHPSWSICIVPLPGSLLQLLRKDYCQTWTRYRGAPVNPS